MPKEQKPVSTKKTDDKFLVQHEHSRSVFRPENFTRFNDGIIQACLLRLATPAELDYAVDEELSSKMLVTMKTIFTKEDPDASEAILEFLYALAIKKIKLITTHEIDLVQYLKNEFKENEMIVTFLVMIERQ